MLAILVYLSPEFVFMLHSSSHAGHITAACIPLHLIILTMFSEIFTGCFILYTVILTSFQISRNCNWQRAEWLLMSDNVRRRVQPEGSTGNLQDFQLSLLCCQGFRFLGCDAVSDVWFLALQ
jgi:hypothetical protein